MGCVTSSDFPDPDDWCKARCCHDLKASENPTEPSAVARDAYEKLHLVIKFVYIVWDVPSKGLLEATQQLVYSVDWKVFAVSRMIHEI